MIRQTTSPHPSWITIPGSILLALVIAAGFFYLVSPVMVVSADTPVYVRPGGDDTACDGLHNEDYPGSPAGECAYRSITKGVAEVDLAGTVFVASELATPGLYDESVLLNRGITVTVTGPITVTGDLTITQGTFRAPIGILWLQGNYTNYVPGESGGFKNRFGIIVFDGSAQQTIGGSQVASFHNVILSNPNHVLMATNTSISGDLSFPQGSLILPSGTLEMDINATTTGPFDSNRKIALGPTARVCKGYLRGYGGPFPVNFTFPVGDNVWLGGADFSPVRVSVTSGTFANDPAVPQICARVLDQLHPHNFFPSALSRYWLLTSKDITNLNTNLTFTYETSDIIGTESYLRGLQRIGSSWEIGDAVNPATNQFTITASSMTTYTAGGQEIPIEVLSFETLTQKGGVNVAWETANEGSLSGFYLRRSIGALNLADPPISALIPAHGDGDYDYLDSDADPGVDYNYWLEVVPQVGDSEILGPAAGIWYSYTFSSAPNTSGVELTWSAENETGMAGFNLYRSIVPVKPSSALNGLTLIPPHASPFIYQYLDTTALSRQPYYYWLEIVAASTYSETFGPIDGEWSYRSLLPIIVK